MTFGVWHERDSGKAGAETTAVVLITLGIMTLGVRHERDSGIVEGGGRFSQTRELKSNLKWGTISHSCFKVWGHPLKRESIERGHDQDRLRK